MGYRRRQQQPREAPLFKTNLALAIGLSFALLTAPASAQQGPSYEGRGYGGPLYVGPNFQHGGQWSPPVYGSGSREPSHRTERYRAPQRLDRVQRKRNSDDEDVKTAKKTPAAKESQDAKATNENSSIVSTASDKDKAASTTTPATDSPKADAKKTHTAKADSANSRNENSTIAGRVASTPTAKSESVKAEVTKADTDRSAKTPATCKRYFPTVGQTITVPCD
jgi:hypothetical protein